MQVFNENDFVPVPSSLGFCPDCNQPLFVQLCEWVPIYFDKAHLSAPGDNFDLKCSSGHIWWISRLEEGEYHIAWHELHQNVGDWLKGLPFLMQKNVTRPQEDREELNKSLKSKLIH